MRKELNRTVLRVVHMERDVELVAAVAILDRK